MIVSIFLFNAETWALTKKEKEVLRKNYMRLARSAMGERKVQFRGTDKWESDESFLTRHRLESLDRIIAQRKAIWIGHIERSKDEDFKNQMSILREGDEIL